MAARITRTLSSLKGNNSLNFNPHSQPGRLIPAARPSVTQLLVVGVLLAVLTIAIGAFCLFMSESPNKAERYIWRWAWPILTLLSAFLIRLVTGLPAMSISGFVWAIIITILSALPMKYILFPPKHDRFGGAAIALLQLNFALLYFLPVIAAMTLFSLRIENRPRSWYWATVLAFLLPGTLILATQIYIRL